MKRRLITQEDGAQTDCNVNYSMIRARFYGGLLIFLAPASFAIYRDTAGNETWIDNEAWGAQYEIVRGRYVEQTFVSLGGAIDRVSLFINTSNRMLDDNISLEIVDGRGNLVGGTHKSIHPSHESAWHSFDFKSARVLKNSLYRIRLNSSAGIPGNAFTVYASANKTDRFGTYKLGEATVSGAPQNSDLSFRVFFKKEGR